MRLAGCLIVVVAILVTVVYSKDSLVLNSASIVQDATSAVEKLEELKTDTSLQQEEKNFIDNCLASVRGLLTGSLKAVNMVTRLENGELSDAAPSLLAVIPSTNPYKRAEGEPFVSVIGLDSNSQSLRVLVGYAQTFISAVEKIGLALPYGFKLQYMDASHIDDAQAVVYDVASGTVLLHPRWADHISSLPLEFVEETYSSMSEMVASASGSPVDILVQVGQGVVGALKYGMWECILCIIVLGIGFPLAANFLLAGIVEWLCHEMQIVPATCTQYMLCVLVLVDLLLPLFAYAIFKICKLQSKSCTSLA